MSTTPLRPSAAVSVRGLTRRFGTNVVLDQLHLDLEAGSFVALLGRSGSGKSTLLRTLAGLDAVTEGSVQVPPERAVVFQEPRLVPWKRVAVNVAMGIRSADREERTARVLGEVGLTHRAQAWPVTLSGGEAQRAALARALMRDPRLLLLDEPFAALDALTRMNMQRMVEALWAARRPSVLLVTHDVDEALQLADRVLVLADGRIALDQPVNVPRPREPDDARYAGLRRALLNALGVETTPALETIAA